MQTASAVEDAHAHAHAHGCEHGYEDADGYSQPMVVMLQMCSVHRPP